MKRQALDYAGDSHPGEEPQNLADRQAEMPGRNKDWNPSEDYKFFYGNGQLHVSDSHDHDQLALHAGVGPDHTGPMALGHIHVDMGKATFQMDSNIHAKGMSRILKDYCDDQGWRWGGMTDLQGEPVDTGSEFAPVKSYYYAIEGDHLLLAKVASNLSSSAAGAVHVAGNVAYLHGPGHEGLLEFAQDRGFTLIGGNDNVLKRIEDLETDNNYSPEWNDEDDHGMFQNGSDDRQPGGVFRCPDCARIFPNWGTYLMHRREEENVNDIQDRSKFPELDPDAVFPPHESEPMKDWTSSTQLPLGYPWKPGTKVRNVFNEVATVVACDPNSDKVSIRFDDKPAPYNQMEVSHRTLKVAAGTDPKDLIGGPLPFIYDIQDDKVTMGQPGQRTSDIPGQFTPGGIVEGTYEPGGKVVLRSLTNMPYTVRHLLELWYYTLPHMEVKSVHLEDAEGKSQKLARRLGGHDVGGYLTAMLAADPAAWAADRALRAAGGEVYIVGGAVRDAMLGKHPKDIDLMVTGIPPATVMGALNKLDGRVDLTGKDFGVFRYRAKGGAEVEVALPRREKSNGSGHQDFDVQADHTMSAEEDLYRRDFTINAMAVNTSNGQVIDPHGGAQDIHHRELRTLNTKSLSDDPLRTVRALVAVSRFGLHPSKETREQMLDNAAGLLHLPKERIQAELDKLFKGDHLEKAIKLANETGTLEHIFPEVANAFGYDQQNPHHELELGKHLVNVMSRVAEQTEDPDLRLAGLLHDIGKPKSRWTECKSCGHSAHGPFRSCPSCGSDKVSGHYYEKKLDDGTSVGHAHEDVGAQMAEDRLRELKYPRERIQRIRDLIQHHMYPGFSSERGARRFLNKVGDHADDLFTLRWADQGGKSENPADPSQTLDAERAHVEAVRSANQPTQRSQLAINGGDLIGIGFKPGPQMGQVLNQLLEETLDDPSFNNKEFLLQRAREML